MRAEDIREGMWLRTESGAACRVMAVNDGVYVASVSDDLWIIPARKLEHWTPRVGDWVRSNDSMVGQVSSVDMECGICAIRSGGAVWTAFVSRCEPCAAPEAKPGIVEQLEAPLRKAEADDL